MRGGRMWSGWFRWWRRGFGAGRRRGRDRIEPKWMHHVMGRADRYYSGEDVPVLQLVYPDRENRFQDEDGFAEYFRQPLLGPDVTWGRLEEDFWAANDVSSILSRWQFPDAP